MPGDPVLESVRHLVGESLAELRSSLEGLTAEAMNWLPVDGANSIAILATHTVHSTRLWLSIAMGVALPERDRDSEFLATADDADAFRAMVGSFLQDCLDALGSTEAVDWTHMRTTQGRGGDAPPEVPAAYALIHATEHLRGHVDQVSLMRHLWDSRNAM